MKKLSCLLIALLSLTSCATTTPTNTKKNVITTFFPYYVFAKNLAGDYLNVDVFISNQIGPHDYQLKPADVKKLSSADIIIKNGLGLDDWIDHAITTANSNATILTASKDLDLLKPIHLHELIAASDEDDEDKGQFDPHVWVSPQNVLHILPQITAAFIQLDPLHKTEFEQLLQNYSTQIQQLDQDIKTTLTGIPNKEFVSFHSATQYFARDYGLQVSATIQTYPDEDPTPYYLKKLSDYVLNNHIKVIATEPQFSPRIVETLAHDLHLQVITFDPLETGIFSLTTYQDTLRKNVAELANALQ